jgi:hypothetical protein
MTTETKTIIIFDNCGEDIIFFVVPGDHSELSDTYINASDEEDANKLYELLYTPTGAFRHSVLHEFPKEVLIEDPQTVVIVVGFAP